MSPMKKVNRPTKSPQETTTTGRDFLDPPPSIMARDIKEAITADVVVIGAGIAGMTAAVSAAEAGARVVLLEKGPGYNFRGLHNAAIAGRLQKEAGIKVDKERLIYTIMETAAYRGDQRVVKIWADNCDDAMDWLLDMADEAGIEVVLDPTTKPWYFPNYPLIYVFMPGRQETLAEMLHARARSLGVDFYFETPAVRLLRKEKGKVTGVLVRNNGGDYLQFNAGKAVVLCTGDYGSDRRMVEKYCWQGVSKLPSLYPGMTEIAYAAQKISGPYNKEPNTGDGHKMGMWIGAAIDDPPHCAMLFDYTIWSGAKLFDLARQPWLYVNLKGERFMNEDIPWGYECAQLMQQPGNIAWSIWDDKYDHEWPKMQSQCCKNMGPPTNLWNPKWLGDAIKEGNVLTAWTIEELARKMDVPVETFKATVARYNEMANRRKDLDFGKHPDRLTTVEEPLFYATQVTAVFLVILGGLKINHRLQVLDTDGKVIPGLYAAGNVSGSFFGSQYPTTAPGLSHSRAWTFGRLAGMNAAAEKRKS
jgi:fumarate reductase flavoprotein subunit